MEHLKKYWFLYLLLALGLGWLVSKGISGAGIGANNKYPEGRPPTGIQ